MHCWPAGGEREREIPGDQEIERRERETTERPRDERERRDREGERQQLELDPELEARRL